jgi:hypothetical protein
MTDPYVDLVTALGFRSANAARVLRELGQAARTGAKCPTNAELGKMPTDFVPRLDRAGVLTIEVYAKNFRRVVIHKGPDAGYATAFPSGGGRPYKGIGL